MSHMLDRPVWSALTGPHAGLALGNERARRYGADMVAFAATLDDGPESLSALEALMQDGTGRVLVQTTPIVLPPGIVATTMARCVQLFASRSLPVIADERVAALTEADAEDMLALANLTKPGPYAIKALALGRFWGVKRDGLLVAMAGERMRQTGWTELSGVCTHPDHRGEGLGRLLSAYVAGQIAARGETAYLHAFASNTGAIGLYQSLGFDLRAELNVAMVQRRS